VADVSAEHAGGLLNRRALRGTSGSTRGEGWHNNHHAHPFSARHGLAWYEIDLNYYGIWIMGRLGLAKKINVPTIAQMAIASPGFPATGSNCD
jgi:hypothetical protein